MAGCGAQTLSRAETHEAVLSQLWRGDHASEPAAVCELGCHGLTPTGRLGFNATAGRVDRTLPCRQISPLGIEHIRATPKPRRVERERTSKALVTTPRAGHTSRRKLLRSILRLNSSPRGCRLGSARVDSTFRGRSGGRRDNVVTRGSLQLQAAGRRSCRLRWCGALSGEHTSGAAQCWAERARWTAPPAPRLGRRAGEDAARIGSGHASTGAREIPARGAAAPGAGRLRWSGE